MKKIKRSKNKTLLKIVKRRGHTELYDERKVYASCFFACRNAELNEKEAEEICNKISKDVTKWISKRKMVTSDDIFKFLVIELKKYNQDVSFLYETHRDIS